MILKEETQTNWLPLILFIIIGYFLIKHKNIFSPASYQNDEKWEIIRDKETGRISNIVVKRNAKET